MPLLNIATFWQLATSDQDSPYRERHADVSVFHRMLWPTMPSPAKSLSGTPNQAPTSLHLSVCLLAHFSPCKTCRRLVRLAFSEIFDFLLLFDVLYAETWVGSVSVSTRVVLL
jgi:hypothetical protein